MNAFPFLWTLGIWRMTGKMVPPNMSPSQGPRNKSDSLLHKAPRGRFNTKRLVIFVLGVLVLVVAIGTGGSFLYGQYLFGKVHRVVITAENPQVAGKPINVLLIGNNTRAGLSPSEAAAFGTTSQVGGGRADVSMIAHFDPTTKQVTLLSIPRDLFMPIPGTKNLQRVDAELNPTSSQSNTENPNQLVKTIEYDLGIPIQHYVELNFDTFQGVVNALGGIKMYFPMQVRDAYSRLNVTTTGCLTLNGAQALQVVRARHLYYLNANGVWVEDGLGDLSRTRRDHIFLQVLAEQLKAAGLKNPVRDLTLLNSVYQDLTLDSTFTESELLSLILTYRNANPLAAVTGTLPIAYENNYIYSGVNYQSVVFPQEPADSELIHQTLGLITTNISPSNIDLTVVNASNLANQGTLVAGRLLALGYQVGPPVTLTPLANPVESVIYYTPGNLAKAEVLRASLGGSVIMGQVPSTGYATPLELLAGDQLAVATNLAVPVSTTSNTPATSPQGPSSTKASPTTTIASHATISVPDITRGTQVNTIQQAEPWDPRACPA